MISDPKNLSEQLCNLSERLGIEMRVLNRTKVSTVNGSIPDNSGAVTVDVGVKKVNGVAPDANGNVTIQTGGDTSNLVPKTGDRGVLAGFNTLNFLVDPTETVVINGSTNDDTRVLVSSAEVDVSVSFEKGGAETWCKQVVIFNQGGTVTLQLPEDGSIAFETLDDAYQTGGLDLLIFVWYGELELGLIYTKQLV